MRGRTADDTVIWRDDADAAEWDRALAALGGHPLQSALWGDARRKIDRIHDHRLLAYSNDTPVFMLRVEERTMPLVGRIGWAPRGPAGTGIPQISEKVLHWLKEKKFDLLVTDRWIAVNSAGVSSRKPRTIWLDLSDRDVVWNGFHAQMRKGVRRAERGGVVTRSTTDQREIAKFVELCAQTSQVKKFELRIDNQLVRELLERSPTSPNVETALLTANRNGKFGAGLFVFRVGRSMHQIWGAMDRELRQERVGEAVQWAAMNWAFERGCTRYDLEGIDPAGNPSVYAFKKRLGGNETTLAGKEYYPLGFRGRLLAWIDYGFR